MVKILALEFYLFFGQLFGNSPFVQISRIQRRRANQHNDIHYIDTWHKVLKCDTLQNNGLTLYWVSHYIDQYTEGGGTE